MNRDAVAAEQRRADPLEQIQAIRLDLTRGGLDEAA